MTRPSWLPPLLPVGGTREEVIASLYEVFARDFKRVGCALRGASVRYGSVAIGEQYEESFWHIISHEGRSAGSRSFDTCRAERLSWCKPVIENAGEAAVSAWEDRVRRRTRTFLWLEEHDYVVVLERGGRRGRNFAFLVTAYCVEGRRGRKALRTSRARGLPL